MSADTPGLATQPLFVALTRPQMICGVTYPYLVLNLIASTEAFLVTKSYLALLLFAAIHAAGYATCLTEPRRFDLYLTRAVRARRTRNAALWGGNSYAP